MPKRIMSENEKIRNRERAKAWAIANPEKAKARRAKWLEKNKEHYAQKLRDYADKNKERISEMHREYYVRNIESIRTKGEIYRDNNREVIREKGRAVAKRNRLKRRPYMKAYCSKRRNEDLNFRLLGNLRNRVRIAVKKTRGEKAHRTIALIGCTIPELRAHLESQFVPGMAWTNYGSGWHIDHRHPCARYDLRCPDQQRECFHWTNLQPLWAFDNLSKGARALPYPRTSSAVASAVPEPVG